jgi:hypothetical protein
MTMLTLKRASKSRSGGQWSDDDYDVFDGDRRVGPFCHSLNVLAITRADQPRVITSHSTML